MKKLIFAIGLLCVCQFSDAQLYYNFAASQGSYSPMAGGTIAALTPSYLSEKTLLDESFINDVPIGFVFQYNGLNITKLHLNSNGFAALGAPFLIGDAINPDYNVNELRNGSGFKATVRPVLAPFWDDLIFTDASSLSYKTSGTSPNRVFVAQWQNMIWQSGPPAISFQLKLYENTNAIDFVYQALPGTGGGNKSASIGITSENNQRGLIDIDSLNFMSLSSAASTAAIVSTVEADNIFSTPVTGQVFSFTPVACSPVGAIHVSAYNDNTAVIKWNAGTGNPSYEYAISNIDIQPNAGTIGTDTVVRFEGLANNAIYYFFIKKGCDNNWKKITFKTSANAELPYNEGFENTIDTELPATMSSQNNSNIFADVFWQTTDLLTPAEGRKVAFNSSPYVNAGTWLFTPSFNLLQGRQYRISYKVSTAGGSHAMEIKYGKFAGEDSMRYRIGGDSNITNTAYQLKEFSFSPASTGDYIIGLSYKSQINNKILLLDELSVKTTDVVLSIDNLFTATLIDNSLVKLEWKNSNDRNAEYFSIERSTDGNNFAAIGRINRTIGSGPNGNYEYFDRAPEIGVNYYRIKLVEPGGRITFSPVRSVRVTDYLITSLYPNPSAKEVFLKMNNTDGVSIRGVFIKMVHWSRSLQTL